MNEKVEAIVGQKFTVTSVSVFLRHLAHSHLHAGTLTDCRPTVAGSVLT